MSMVEPILFGVLNGIVIGLIALGLTLVFGVMGIVNIAHGAILVLGSYVTIYLFSVHGVNPLVASVPSAIISGLFALMIYKTTIDILPDLDEEDEELNTLVLFFGLTLFLIGMYQVVFSSDFQSYTYLLESYSIGGIQIRKVRAYAAIASLALTVIFYLFLKKTTTGKAIRATSQNRDVAKQVGINVDRIDTIVYTLGGVLAGFAGSFVSMYSITAPEKSLNIIFEAFIVVIVGGLGSFPGAILGGILIGTTEALAESLAGGIAAQVAVFGMLAVVLLIRPQGLLGEQSPEGEN